MSAAGEAPQGPLRFLIFQGGRRLDDLLASVAVDHDLRHRARGASFAYAFGLCPKQKGEGACLHRLRGCARRAGETR